METRLQQLKKEESELKKGVGELEATITRMRAEMINDPVKKAAQFSQLVVNKETQLTIFKEKIETVKIQILAEEARLNSPEVKRDIKQAEKLIAENREASKSINERLYNILQENAALLVRADQAAQLLAAGGRDPSEAYTADFQIAVEIKKIYDRQASLRDALAAFSASVVETIAREKAAKEQAIKDKPARHNAALIKLFGG